METCANCGATIRSGARFCTTCGTRVHIPSTDDSGWGAAVKTENTDDQQTSVLEPIKLPDPAPKNPTTSDNDRWAAGWGTSQPASDTNDPASRFITALDDEVKPATDDNSWATPSWSFSNQTESWGAWGDSQTATEESQEETPTGPKTFVENADDVAESTIDSIRTDTVEDTIEQVLATGAAAGIPDSDPRHRIVELLSELQALVPQITPIDNGSAAMTLTEASLKAGDFADLQDVIAQVQDDPRDIKALSDLAEKIDRIDALLKAHASLNDAIESALHDLGSQ